MLYGLKQSTITVIQDVFKKDPQVKKVVLYGSRAKGTFRTGSDIDLVVIAPEMTLRQLNHIETELDDLLLPFKLDISLLHHIDNKELLDHINRVGVDFM